MRVVVTGAASGIGLAVIQKFLEEGHTVFGIDIESATYAHPNYKHFVADVRGPLPDIENVDILINNAGVQNSGADIDINLKGLINCTEKYGVQPKISSIVNIAASSAHTGADFPEYCASKGGVLAYTVNVAKRIAKYGATCNSLSFGGVLTDLNDCVMNDPVKWKQIMDMTPLKRWTTAKECAIWIYFMAMVNQSCSGQDIVIDNLESFNHTFVWKD